MIAIPFATDRGWGRWHVFNRTQHDIFDTETLLSLIRDPQLRADVRRWHRDEIDELTRRELLTGAGP